MHDHSTMRIAQRLTGRIMISPAGCWVWTGACNDDGYGWFEMDRRRVMVHRFVFAVCVGPIPDGLWVLHDCPEGDNPKCVNPAHLWLGDAGDNNRDCAAKGRHRDAKIRPDQVAEIRRRLAAGKHGIVKQLADEYGVSPQTISHLRRGRHWRHVG